MSTQNHIPGMIPESLENNSNLAFVDHAQHLDLRQRSNLIELDRHLHELWSLGKNCILGWSPTADGIDLLVVHHYAIANYTIATAHQPANRPPISDDTHLFVVRMLTGSRQLSTRHLSNAAKLFDCEPCHYKMRQPLEEHSVEAQIVDRLVQRYSVSYVPNRAVALFDIVGFSLLSPFEQMTQINSLSYSMNSAHSKMLTKQMNINFARSSTGDGFYIWNRDLGAKANSQLYHFMHLTLADNAIASSKARGRTVPKLRAGFHVGSCYEFYQAEGLNPAVHSYIVGDVTIELARMIERALPGQILVGEFQVGSMNDEIGRSLSGEIDAIRFIEIAQRDLSQLNGLELAGDAIESIKCYLTGPPQADGTFTIRKLVLNDKHGLTRRVFNAKINIYRIGSTPILLGIEDRCLHGDNSIVTPVEQITTN
ncbi:MAG TPA: hypothetical protein QF499_12535 [Gammaproteobacteria bacterium]|jgi:hypothetical protein|nr:hypothetical protein [Gammaproteobacteria bacterium]HJP39937.1 hypothetical protein [Gammaproteobacteria bacterium]